MNYKKIKFILPNNKTRVIWAIECSPANSKLHYYTVTNKEGTPKGELVVVANDDIIWDRLAKMNLKYAELELA